jgi:hypothetical protein
MRCFIKNGKVELLDVGEGFSSSTDGARVSVFELQKRAQESARVRAPERAMQLASQLGDMMRERENRAVQVHDSLDPIRVFELLQ